MAKPLNLPLRPTPPRVAINPDPVPVRPRPNAPSILQPRLVHNDAKRGGK